MVPHSEKPIHQQILFRLFQAQMLRRYVLDWDRRPGGYGYDRRWLIEVGRYTREGMLRRARIIYEDCLATIHHISLSHPFPAGLTLPAFEDLPRGGIVGTVEIVDCVEQSDSPWFFGRYGFVLRNPQVLPEIIPVKGALGFFDWRERLTGKPNRVVQPQGQLL